MFRIGLWVEELEEKKMLLFSGLDVRPNRLKKVVSEFLIMVAEVTSALQKIMRSSAKQRWVNLVFELSGGN